MKKSIIISIIFAAGLMMPVSLFADTAGSARISIAEGEVLIQTRDTGSEWTAASINLPLLAEDRIWVPENGRLEIQFLKGSYVRADKNTGLNIIKVNRDNEGDNTRVAVTLGRAYVYCHGAADSNSLFQVDTPLVSATAQNSAIFDVCVHDDGYTEVAVIKGTVLVEGERVNTRVYAGDMVSVRADKYADLSPRRADDGWLSWNIAKDALIAGTGASVKHLPPALHDYSADFDHYGYWVQTTEYGHVWRPRLTINVWAPYRHGRWIWKNRDYVWISYEPWGWAPYHYGRWSFSAGIGWFWVPPAVNDVYWGPGFVAWINRPTYVSWVPLAPREIYYGYGYYGRHSVDLGGGGLRHIKATNVYLNCRAPHAVTVVHRDAFIKGRHIEVRNAPANPFLAGLRVSTERPAIRQVNCSPLPLVKPGAMPPAGSRGQQRKPVNASISRSAVYRVEPGTETRVSRQAPSQKPKNAFAYNTSTRRVEPEATPPPGSRGQQQKPVNASISHSAVYRVEPGTATRVSRQTPAQKPKNTFAYNTSTRRVEAGTAPAKVERQTPNQGPGNDFVRNSDKNRRQEPKTASASDKNRKYGRKK